MLYIVCTPQNKLDKKGRVSGWHFVPLERKAKQEWRTMLAPLKGMTIHAVIGSDLDGEAVRVASDELHVAARTDYIYRRFNVGRFHARDAAIADGAIRAMEEKWKSNADVPIREGDSLTSYRKRFIANFQKLLEKEGDYLFVTDARSIAVIRDGFAPHALIPNGNPVKLDKIFKVSCVRTK